jgi:arylsulfatase A
LSAPFVQLFDLSKDLHEDHNLAAQHPERVAQMVALLQKQVANGRSTPGPELGNDKHVKIVNLDDKRLPEIVRRRAR